jgi:hypothetical protein
MHTNLSKNKFLKTKNFKRPISLINTKPKGLVYYASGTNAPHAAQIISTYPTKILRRLPYKLQTAKRVLGTIRKKNINRLKGRVSVGVTKYNGRLSVSNLRTPKQYTQGLAIYRRKIGRTRGRVVGAAGRRPSHNFGLSRPTNTNYTGVSPNLLKRSLLNITKLKQFSSKLLTNRLSKLKPTPFTSLRIKGSVSPLLKRLQLRFTGNSNLFTKKPLKWKKTKRYVYRGHSHLPGQLYSKPWATSGGLINTAHQQFKLAQVQNYITKSVYTGASTVLERPFNLLITRSFIAYTLPALHQTTSLTLLYGNHTNLVTNPAVFLKSAIPTWERPNQLIRLGSFPSSRNVVGLPKNLNPQALSLGTTQLASISKRSTNYLNSQALYNSIQSLLVYRNAFRQQLATSPKASLILSFETRTTRLNTLPIFLEMRKKPFGSDVKVVQFTHSGPELHNLAQTYFSTFVTPIYTNSFVHQKSNKPHFPTPMRTVTILDLQLKLCKVGPKPKPILGFKPQNSAEVLLNRQLRLLRYRLRVLLKNSYKQLVGPNKSRGIYNHGTKSSIVGVKSKPLTLLRLIGRMCQTWVRVNSRKLSKGLLTRFTSLKPVRSAQQKTRSTPTRLGTKLLTRLSPVSLKNLALPQYRSLKPSTNLGLFRWGKYKSRLPIKKTSKKRYNTFTLGKLPQKLTKRTHKILKKLKHVDDLRAKRFFHMLNFQSGTYQRRLYLNFQKKHLISDFQQTAVNPDYLMPRRSLLGLKSSLVKGTPTKQTLLGCKSTMLVFNTRSLLNISQPQLLLWVFMNPFLLKLLLHSFSPHMYGPGGSLGVNSVYDRTRSRYLITDFVNLVQFTLNKFSQPLENKNYQVSRIVTHSNLLPNKVFSSTITKYVSSLHLHNKIREDFVPIYFHTLVRFVEAATGKRFILQFYPFLHQNIPLMILIRYKQWIPKMKMYERRLGHKFFFEESLHIMHLSFALRDAVLFSSWLKIMIRRISFWKTRLIFRFLRYLFINFFSTILPELKIRGIKIKLKGKISVGGNSRKRTIYFRSGESSYSRVDLRVSHHKQTIGTFTGVQGLQLWIFY